MPRRQQLSCSMRLRASVPNNAKRAIYDLRRRKVARPFRQRAERGVRERVSLATGQARQKSSATHASSATRNLHKVGEAVAKAVLDKDIATLLSYDRADLRS